MKKLYLFNCLFFLLGLTSSGQSLINNHWKLGQTDLNFTNVTPTAGVTGNANYGKATVSDSAGNLLFYTNGYNVWNKNNGIMTNGSTIIYCSENFDIINTVIVPNPGNNKQYYIISSVNVTCIGGGGSQVRCLNYTNYLYSLVEFNTTYPLGVLLRVTTVPSGSEETNYSKLFYTSNQRNLYFGPLTVAKGSDNNSYWVILQDKNIIKSYKIDSGGLNLTPVQSTFTNSQIFDLGVWNSTDGTINGIEGADFRITPNNTKLVGLQYSKWNQPNEPDASANPNSAINFKNYFYTLDFNPTTGAFSNYQLLTGTGIAIEEFEISNNSNNLFYVRKRHPSAVNTGSTVVDGEVVVKDLTNNATAVRILKEFVSTTTPSSAFSYIQKDRNGNILLSSIFTTNSRNMYVHKIENQNSFASSSVNVNFVSLNSNPISVLPQLIPEFEAIPTCTPLTLTTEPHTSNFTYSGYSNITTNTNYSITQANLDIKMYARDYILLQPNTHIKKESKFLAKIVSCESIVTKTSDDSSSYDNEYNLESKDISIYPNPTNSIFTVESKNQKIVGVEIYSIDGKLIYNNSLNKTERFELDISNYSKGIYILNIQTDKGEKVSRKLLKD